jgi:hypothetical protein
MTPRAQNITQRLTSFVWINVDGKSQGIQNIIHKPNFTITYTYIYIYIYIYSVIQKDGLNFVRLYFLNYIWYVNDLLTFERGSHKFSNTTARALAHAQQCSSVS